MKDGKPPDDQRETGNILAALTAIAAAVYILVTLYASR